MPEPQHLTEEEEAAQRDQQRHGAANDRIDLTQFAMPVGRNQKQAVADLEARRQQYVGPGGGSGDGNHEQQGQGDDASSEAHHCDRPQPVRSGAQKGIPTGMQDGSYQRQTDGDGTHGRGLRDERSNSWMFMEDLQGGI